MIATKTVTPNAENQIDTTHEIIFPQGEFYSHEPPLETYQHLQQIIILLKSLQWLWRDRDDYFCAGNLTIYYSPNQKKSEYFRGPDFFVVLDTTNDQTRKSWVVWQENGKYPNVIVEILSNSTAKTDRGEKKQIYQEIFRTPDYFCFDPVTMELEGFTLVSGKYKAIERNESGWLYSQQLGLYLGIYEGKLRYFTLEGDLVPTPEEVAIQENRKKNSALQQLKIEKQKVEKLREKLKELGINPDEIYIEKK